MKNAYWFKAKCSVLAVFLVLLVSFRAKAQLVVTTSGSATLLANTLAGAGTTVFGATITCPAAASGTFTSTGTLISMASGIVLTNGHASACSGVEPPLTSFNDGAPGDASFVTLGVLPAGTATFDACELEFNVVATGDTLSFNYQLGSDEYRTAVCSPYNDAFAFFISGPGIISTPNMALVPGTNIPVEINSVNNGIPGTSGGLYSNCTMLGAGSPFTAYYLDNTGGTLLSYRGYTDKFKAFHTVTPCDTYHLKLAIVDAGNAIYDSGVFLEAGSLHTSTLHFNHTLAIGATINGIPNAIVKGCNPATLGVIGTPATSIGHTVHFTFGGTGVSGTDYTSPDSVTIPAGDTSTTFNVSGIPTPPLGTKTVTIYLMSSCGLRSDSVTVNILDTPSAYILTPDTSVCGSSVLIRTTGTAGLTYLWTPSTGLSSATIAQPTATPVATTTYTMTATLPGSGCPPIVRTITISIGAVSISMITPDTTICAGNFVDILVAGSGTLTYNWSPGTGLSSTTVQDPIATPTVTTTYTVTGSLPGSGCASAVQHITITVVNITDSILTQDTTICMGNSFTIHTMGTEGLTYSWTPALGLSSTSVPNPIATPTVNTTYVLSATLPGCPTLVKNLTVNVDNIAINMITPDTIICLGNVVDILVGGSAAYTYNWTPTSSLSSATIQDPIATPTITTTYTVTASETGSVCPAVAKQITITVVTISDSILTQDTTICLGASFTIRTTGTVGMSYSWSPAIGLSSATVADPIANPTTTTNYVLTGTLPGCPTIVKNLNVVVESTSITTGADVTICQGGVPVNLSVTGSPSYTYNWLPTAGVSNPNIQNPVATPAITTIYTVTATLPDGHCPSTAYQTVTVLGIAPITMATANQSICMGGLVPLAVNGDVSLIYTWTPATGLDNPNIPNPVASPTTTTTYVVTASGAGGVCSSTASITITVSQITASVITHDTGICVGQSVQILVSGDPAYTYNWSPANGLNDPNLMNPIATPATTTTYTFTATNAATIGCSATGTLKITVSKPVAPWIKEPVLTYCQTFVADSLTADIVYGQNLTWYSNYYDTIGSPISPIPTTEQLGTYYYFVSQDIDNCNSTRSAIVVNVVPCCEGTVFIPTSFSPNNDGLNDFFVVKRPIHMAIDEIKIFDRWGNQVFAGNGSNDKWDGNYMGKPCEIGTYYYYVQLICSDGETGKVKWVKGDITLVR